MLLPREYVSQPNKKTFKNRSIFKKAAPQTVCDWFITEDPFPMSPGNWGSENTPTLQISSELAQSFHKICILILEFNVLLGNTIFIFVGFNFIWFSHFHPNRYSVHPTSTGKNDCLLKNSVLSLRLSSGFVFILYPVSISISPVLSFLANRLLQRLTWQTQFHMEGQVILT